jgi:hypothetical protein
MRNVETIDLSHLLAVCGGFPKGTPQPRQPEDNGDWTDNLVRKLRPDGTVDPKIFRPTPDTKDKIEKSWDPFAPSPNKGKA